MKDPQEQQGKPKSVPVVSKQLRDKRLVELVYDPEESTTSLIVGDASAWRQESSISVSENLQYAPYAPSNNLIRHNVILFPSQPEEFGTERDLIRDVRAHIRRYNDLSDRFEKVATYYVLLTWLHDAFNEVPYLRMHGDYGTGKTRFLLSVGSLCYKPIYASGASTVAPLFHMLDRFGGTLILDEADFRFSDEKSDIAKILNEGNNQGASVLRMRGSHNNEFDVRPFRVFGPKIVAARGYYDDRGLESRFITEETNRKPLRPDIPINLPHSARHEARHLRNRLLLFRFRRFAQVGAIDNESLPGIEPRLRQIFLPLLSVVDDPEVRQELTALANEYHEDLTADRALEPEAMVLEILRDQFAAGHKNVPIKQIADQFKRRCDDEYKEHVSNRWIARIVRKRLWLATYKSNGVFVVPFTEAAKLGHLYARYGLTEGQ